MNRWHEWRKAALLGTQRTKPPAPAATGEPLSQLLAALPRDDDTRFLLSSIAVLAAYEAAGQTAPTAAHLPELSAAPPHARPVCSPRAARYLEIMLSGQFRSQLKPFLSYLVDHNLRVPDALLPNLLQAGVRSGSLRLVLRELLDDHGRWLAAQNPEWQLFSSHLDDWEQLRARWQDASNTRRQQLLTQLRHLHPPLGRELLAAQWKQLPEMVRRWGIKSLLTNLSMADEPFLEMALDDRDLTVRRQAVNGLTHLPDSRLSRRMTAVAAEWIQWQTGLSSRITVTFPDTIPPPLVRDGVQKEGLNNLSRLRSRQLLHVVGAVPLEFWSDHWQQPPEIIIRAARAGRWPRTLITGWVSAAQRQQNATWAVALLRMQGITTQTSKLVRVLPDEMWLTLMENTLARHGNVKSLDKENPLYHLFRSGQRPWPVPLARIWLQLLARHITHDTATRLPHSTIRMGLQQFGSTCPPELVEEAASLLPPAAEQTPAWRQVVNTFIRTLRFRREMFAALAEPPEANTG